MVYLFSYIKIQEIFITEKGPFLSRWNYGPGFESINNFPSGHSRLSGVPRTEQILNISSISELPGKRGLNQYRLHY